MAKMMLRSCLHDHVLEDGDKRMEMKRGHEYTTTAEPKDGYVTVCSRYWFRAPVEWFAGEVPL